MRNLLLFFISLFSFQSFAQTTISGTVSEKGGELIIGANIFIENTFDGTSSDVDGTFSFSTSEQGEVLLIVSYLGCKNFEQSLHLTGDAINLDIKLKPDAATLQAVTITAGAFEAGDENKTEVLNSVDIATVAGSLADIASAMNTLPGTQRNGETGQLFVRGGAAYETRTFIDGMYAQNPYNSSASNLPARGRFSPFIFKGMSFSTGGYSAEYGQALSSALLLNSQDLAEETITSVSLMSVGGGLAHTQAWDKTSVAVSVDYTNLAPYMQLTPQNIEWDKAPESLSTQLILRQKTSETGLLKFYAMGSRSQMGLQYPNFKDVNQMSPLTLQNDNYFTQATYKEVLGDKWSIRGGVGYTIDENAINADFGLNQKQQTLQSRATLTFQANDHIRLKAGGVAMQKQFNETYTDAEQEFISDFEDTYTAAFVESDIYFSKKLVGRVGGRLEHSSLLNSTNIAPRLSLAYQLRKGEQISLATGQFYQSPENEQLRFTQALDFEQADHYIINYQRIKNDRTFRAEAYLKNYKSLVKFDAAQPWIAGNNGNGYARGVDVFFRDRKSIKNGDYWVSYSYLDTERDYRDFPTAAMPHFASKHNFSAVYKHWIQDINTMFGVTYAYGSPRPFNDPNTNVFNGGRTKPFNDLSANISHLTNLFGQMTILHISASNILNLKNTFGYQFSDTANEDGVYESRAIIPPSNQFLFVGLFVSIGREYTVTKDDL